MKWNNGLMCKTFKAWLGFLRERFPTIGSLYVFPQNHNMQAKCCSCYFQWLQPETWSSRCFPYILASIDGKLLFLPKAHIILQGMPRSLSAMRLHPTSKVHLPPFCLQNGYLDVQLLSELSVFKTIQEKTFKQVRFSYFFQHRRPAIAVESTTQLPIGYHLPC